MRPVRACTSTELSAFRSLEWSFSTALFGGVSSGTVQWPPGSVPGRTIRSVLLLSSVHLAFQSCSTFGFSRSSHCSIGCPIYFSTHCLPAEAGMSGACLCPRLILSRTLIAVQASLICLARPVFQSRAWNRAILPFSQRSSGGTYASVSSCLIGVALNAPSTCRSQLLLHSYSINFLLEMVNWQLEHKRLSRCCRRQAAHCDGDSHSGDHRYRNSELMGYLPKQLYCSPFTLLIRGIFRRHLIAVREIAHLDFAPI